MRDKGRADACLSGPGWGGQPDTMWQEVRHAWPRELAPLTPQTDTCSRELGDRH